MMKTPSQQRRRAGRSSHGELRVSKRSAALLRRRPRLPRPSMSTIMVDVRIIMGVAAAALTNAVTTRLVFRAPSSPGHFPMLRWGILGFLACQFCTIGSHTRPCAIRAFANVTLAIVSRGRRRVWAAATFNFFPTLNIFSKETLGPL